jgi:hypothetical protein
MVMLQVFAFDNAPDGGEQYQREIEKNQTDSRQSLRTGVPGGFKQFTHPFRKGGNDFSHSPTPIVLKMWTFFPFFRHKVKPTGRKSMSCNDPAGRNN